MFICCVCGARLVAGCTQVTGSLMRTGYGLVLAAGWLQLAHLSVGHCPDSVDSVLTVCCARSA